MNIIPAIDRFINNRLYHYSLLINGKWGSGKTYFVKETLIPHIEKTNRDVNYLSLYGIRSTDEITRMLCVQAIKNKIRVIPYLLFYLVRVERTRFLSAPLQRRIKSESKLSFFRFWYARHDGESRASRGMRTSRSNRIKYTK